MAKVKDRYLKPVLKLYDINKNWVCNLTTNNPKNSIFNLKKNMKVNEIDTLSFQVAFDNTHISPNSCEMLIKHEFDWYIIKSVTLNSGDTRYLNVECESEFTISKTVLCETIEIIGETPEQMFNTIMNSVPDNKLNYVFKETDVTNRRSLIVESETSLFENLIKMAEAFECTIRFSCGSNGEKYVSFIKEPHDRGRVIRRNNNLKNLNIVYDTSELFTKIMPFGADDDGIEINIGDVNPTKKLYVENYDYFIAKGMTEGQIKNNMQTQALKVIKYADIVDENDLYTLALRDLEKYSKPRVKGNVEYADLSVLEDSISIEPMIHEKIKIADSEIKMMLTSNISEIEIDYENILNSKITLDNVIEYNSIFKDLIAQGEKIDSVIGTNPNTGKPSLIGSAIHGKIDTAITEIVGQVDVAEKMKPYAILFECNVVGHDLYGAMALGTKGLLIAKEKDIDNSWKWKTAINANGVYSDELVGLTIMGEQIVAGIISSIDKSTWINLETGTFNFADKVKFDGDNFKIDATTILNAVNEEIDNGGAITTTSTKLERGKFTIYNGALIVQNNQAKDVMWCNTEGWLTAANLFINGGENPSNLEIGGVRGNKGIGIRAEEGCSAYLDFGVLDKNASYGDNVKTGKFHRFLTDASNRDILYLVSPHFSLRNYEGNIPTKFTVHGHIGTDSITASEFRRSGTNYSLVATDNIDTIKYAHNGKPYLEIRTKGFGAWGIDMWASDITLKENILKIDSVDKLKGKESNSKIGLDLINSLNHYSYDYIESFGGEHISCGYVAQELKELNSNLVLEVEQEDGSTILQPSAPNIIPNITFALQQQQAEIERLKREIEDLKTLIK